MKAGENCLNCETTTVDVGYETTVRNVTVKMDVGFCGTCPKCGAVFMDHAQIQELQRAYEATLVTPSVR